MKHLTKDEAVSMLICFFNDNKLTFRSINILKAVFDDAVELCNEAREYREADFYNGADGFPDLPSRDTEDDFYSKFRYEVEDRVSKTGKTVDDAVLDAFANMLIEDGNYESRDFYLK